jgi:hypothetical protein
MDSIVFATQPALDDAAHGELVEAPREIDESDEQKQRPDGAPWRGLRHVTVRRCGDVNAPEARVVVSAGLPRCWLE